MTPYIFTVCPPTIAGENMTNMLRDDPDFKIDETPFGAWRRDLYPTGLYFAEFRSRKTVMAQIGSGEFLWPPEIKNPAATAYFESLLP